MKTCLAISVASLFALVQMSTAATTISLEPNNILTIADSQGAAISTLNSGSISEKISADSQTFKISFGQDLQNRHTIIIYPDPENPQSLDLVVLGQPVQMSQDSVLTITASTDGGSSQFQAGVLGEITLAGSPISPGSSLSVQNGQMIATTPTELLDDAAAADLMRQEATAALAASTPVDRANEVIESFNQGMIVKQVTGTVMMAPEGQDVMDMLRGADNVPKLKVGDTIPAGATIRTDFGAEVIVAQSPGVTFQVLPNSNLKVNTNEYKMENGSEKRTFDAYLTKGGIISNLDGVDPKHTDYKIKTPLAVAAARGTAFAVYTSSNITVVVTAEGNVIVTGTDGAVYTATVGEKAIVTFEPSTTGGPGTTQTAEFEATSAEMQAIQQLIAAAQALNSISNNPNTAGTPIQQTFQQLLDDAADNFQNTLDPTLNPGAITPTTSP